MASGAGSPPGSAPRAPHVLVTDVDEAALADVESTLADRGHRGRGGRRRSRPRTTPRTLVVEAALGRFGGLHVLVNNAAVNKRAADPRDGSGDMGLDHAARSAAAVLPLSRRAAEQMIEQGAGGSIITISSLNCVLRARAHLRLRAGQGRAEPADARDGARVGRRTVSGRTRSRPASWTRRSRRRSGPTPSGAAGS